MSQPPSSTGPQVLRPVGDLERFATAKHHLKYYTCVAVTASYVVAEDTSNIEECFEEALAMTVLKHPSLCVGVANEHQHHASFVRIESIDLSKHIDFRGRFSGHTESETDHSVEDLEEVLKNQHCQLWTELDKRPPWKIIILPVHEDKLAFQVVFAYHHVVGDGISGVIFHQSLLEALNSRSTIAQRSEHLLKLPDAIALLPPIEKLVDFSITWAFLLKSIWNTYKNFWFRPLSTDTLPWAANNVNEDQLGDCHHRVKIITIPPEQLSIILAKCREENATLTGLLHGIAVSLLGLRVPEAQSFVVSTPISLRYLLNTRPTRDIAVQAGGFMTNYSQSQLTAIRVAQLDSIKTASNIWSIARAFAAEIQSSLSARNNPIGLLRYIRNVFGYCEGSNSQSRGETLTISNLGAFETKSTGTWSIGKMVFSQPGMVFGAAFAINMVSINGGPLVITTTWRQGVVDDDIVMDVEKGIDIMLNSIGNGAEGIALPVTD